MSIQQHVTDSTVDSQRTEPAPSATETIPTGSPTDDGILRRTVLKASALTVGALAMSPLASAGPTDSDGLEPSQDASSPVDSPSGFGVEVLSRHASFPDAVSAKFKLNYDDGAGTIVSNLPKDASTVIFAKVTWQPEGTSGWHTHPGPVIVSVAEGELEVVNERDCITRTYVAGEAFVDPGQGNVHVASNPSTTDTATAYATFLGVPDGGAPTIWTEPVDC